MHSSHILLSCTPRLHSSHALLSCTPLTHSSHALLAYTPLLHSSHTSPLYTLLLYTLLLFLGPKITRAEFKSFLRFTEEDLDLVTHSLYEHLMRRCSGEAMLLLLLIHHLMARCSDRLDSADRFAELNNNRGASFDR
jgi:hypothetical protein